MQERGGYTLMPGIPALFWGWLAVTACTGGLPTGVRHDQGTSLVPICRVPHMQLVSIG